MSDGDIQRLVDDAFAEHDHDCDGALSFAEFVLVRVALIYIYPPLMYYAPWLYLQAVGASAVAEALAFVP